MEQKHASDTEPGQPPSAGLITPGAQSDALAREILALTRDGLLVAFRFLDVALCALEWQPTDDGSWTTDAVHLYYNPLEVLARYKSGAESLSHDYLHSVLHCVLSHPFAGHRVRPDCWDLACDITVEHIIRELGLPLASSLQTKDQQLVFNQLKKSMKSLTADRIYRYLLNQAMPEAAVADWHRLFFRDEHDRWKRPQESDDSADRDSREGDVPRPDEDAASEDQAGGRPLPDAWSTARAHWKSMGERVAVDLETISQSYAERAGSLTRNIRSVTRDRLDFRHFLRRFMVLGEVMKVDNDTFDYVYYHYGMDRYGNMPLIEPLEYKDEPRIRDFVIAMDTSGSCAGELVQAFVEKTCAIFRQSEHFFRKFNVHVIQCDAEIQSVTRLNSLDQWTGLRDRVQLRGFGGTDFRPVFRYVDRMIAEKEFSNLKGLIYFTDGYGIFPEQKPSYETAFVFMHEDDDRLKVPPWAIRVVLDESDITGGF